MTQSPWAAALAAAVVLAVPASGQDSAPLFAANDILSFRLETDFGAVFKERGQESKEYPAKLSYTAADGSPVTLDIEVRTRGNFRLRPQTCGFPPLRLDFPKGKVSCSTRCSIGCISSWSRPGPCRSCR